MSVDNRSRKAPIAASSEEVKHSRKRLQNPYAYLDGEGRLSALSSKNNPRSVVSVERIESIVRDMQRTLWKRRRELWPEETIQSPLSVLRPDMASKLVGFEMQFVEDLGLNTGRGSGIAAAGEIDRSQMRIRISTAGFTVEEQAFTAAHELGHALLHPQMVSLHRDRGKNGQDIGRDRVEFEADKFATFFLMPSKLVVSEFVGRFLTNKFELDEASAVALTGRSLSKVLKNFPSRRSLSRALANSASFNGKNFHSLASQFGVTVETMAIRLEELKLV